MNEKNKKAQMTKEQAAAKMRELRKMARTVAQEVEIITSREFEELRKIAFPELYK